jgi:hypothetical protein
MNGNVSGQQPDEWGADADFPRSEPAWDFSDGYPIRGLAPPLFCPPFRDGNVTDHLPGGRDRRAS